MNMIERDIESGEVELVLYSAEDRTAHLSSLNGISLGKASFRDGRMRAIVATQSNAPGFFVFAEESSVSIHRSHDLSLVVRIPDTGGAVGCATVWEPWPGRLEVVLGLMSGAVATWVAELAQVAVQ